MEHIYVCSLIWIDQRASCVCACVCISMHMCVHVYCVCVCTCVCVHVCACVCMCVHVCTCMCICVCMCVCMSMYEACQMLSGCLLILVILFSETFNSSSPWQPSNPTSDVSLLPLRSTNWTLPRQHKSATCSKILA